MTDENKIVTETETPQPKIAAFEKKRKNGMGFKALIVLIAVILILMLGGKQILALFKSHSEPEQKIERVDNESSAKKRSDLGSKSYNPLSPPAANAGESYEDDTASNATPKKPSGFQKYLNVTTASSNSSTGAAANTSRYAADKEGNADKSTLERLQVETVKYDPNLYIEEGTFIPCTLRTRFVSDVAGKISCVISQNVYSANGNTVLIEAGTKANGSYQVGSLRHGQGRMFVAWDNLRTPNFKKIYFRNSQVVGELGEAGVDGWVDNHFWERFGGAMMLSIIDDAMAYVTDQASSKDKNTDYTENSRDAMAEMAKVALENSINMPPTIYKNQGDVIGILVGEDIDFSTVYKLRAVK